MKLDEKKGGRGMGGNTFRLWDALLWTAGWFGVILLYTLLHVAVWKRLLPAAAEWADLGTVALCMASLLRLLKSRFGVTPFSRITPGGVLLAAGCAVLLFLALDKGLDPLLESAFPQSEAAYQEMLDALRQAPAASLVRVCVLAPLAEEALMRGLVLGGLQGSYGAGAALLVSALLFALLHFNMVQTLSALVCGLALGLLYLKTGSVGCCVIAHAGYNLLSYLAMLRG